MVLAMLATDKLVTDKIATDKILIVFLARQILAKQAALSIKKQSLTHQVMIRLLPDLCNIWDQSCV